MNIKCFTYATAVTTVVHFTGNDLDYQRNHQFTSHRFKVTTVKGSINQTIYRFIFSEIMCLLLWRSTNYMFRQLYLFKTGTKHFRTHAGTTNSNTENKKETFSSKLSLLCVKPLHLCHQCGSRGGFAAKIKNNALQDERRKKLSSKGINRFVWRGLAALTPTSQAANLPPGINLAHQKYLTAYRSVGQWNVLPHIIRKQTYYFQLGARTLLVL